jgi:hypothetical protein
LSVGAGVLGGRRALLGGQLDHGFHPGRVTGQASMSGVDRPLNSSRAFVRRTPH